METVVVAFEGEKNGRRLKELLESSGTAACLLCRTADQVKRLVRQQRLTAVVCGYKLPDGTAEELAGELPGFCTVLLLAPRGLLELVPERPGLLRLSAPAGRRELLAAVEELLRLGEEAGALLPPRRSREEWEVVERAKADGYVSTLMGRRRWLPELKSSNFNLRSFGERVALNMPIQGTAADLIKKAMLRVDGRLRREGLEARLVLQVHDELIVECPEGEAEQVQRLLAEEMEHVAELAVPLTAEAHAGKSWAEAKG